MDIKALTPNLSISPQILISEMQAVAEAGFKAIICNRPDGEGPDQPSFQEIEAAARQYGLQAQYLPAETGKVRDEDGKVFGQLLHTLPGPVLAYCRSGMRSTTMWALSQSGVTPLPQILEASTKVGFDMKPLVQRIANGGKTPSDQADASHDVVIVGGGAAGISVAASLLQRSPQLDIAIIDPADAHFYQPGWTMVGGGIFKPSETARTMASVIPTDVSWIKAAVAAFEPEHNQVILEGCRVVKYKQLVVCPGLKLDWQGIEGLNDTLGRNGVTSNYRFDLAPYTWELVQNLKGGKALFTQPPMPIKCAGAPQKAMYLSADHWTRQGVLNNIDIQFSNAGAVLFGVTYRVSRPPVCWRFVRCVEEFAAHIVSVLVFFNHFWRWLCAVTVKRLSFMWRAKFAGLLRCGQQTAHSEEAIVCEDCVDERMCPGVEHVPVQPLTRLRRKPPWRRRAAWHTASRSWLAALLRFGGAMHARRVHY